LLLSPLALAPFFFSSDRAPTQRSTLSLHDALPISMCSRRAANISSVSVSRSIFCERSTARSFSPSGVPPGSRVRTTSLPRERRRSEEHTSELQSLTNLVCRLLLEKKTPTMQAPIPH